MYHEREADREFFDDTLGASFEYLTGELQRIVFESYLGPHCGTRHLVKFLLRHGGLTGKRMWCAKTFPSEKVAAGLIRLYPDVRFLYIVRNGSDVVNSRTKFSGFRDQTFMDQCAAWVRGVESFRFLENHERALFLRQEALARDPAAVLEQIWAFLDVEPDNRPLRYLQTTLVHPLDQPDQVGVEVKKALLDRPPAHLGWTASQKETFKSICGEHMRRLGYDTAF